MRPCAILFGIVMFTVAIHAQTLGVVTGQVLESAGRPAAGATVLISTKSWYRIARADDHGRFVVLGVPFQDEYAISASSGHGHAEGRLGAVYPGIQTIMQIRLYDGPTHGMCGSMTAKRLATEVWFAAPFTPVMLPNVCL